MVLGQFYQSHPPPALGTEAKHSGRFLKSESMILSEKPIRIRRKDLLLKRVLVFISLCFIMGYVLTRAWGWIEST